MLIFFALQLFHQKFLLAKEHLLTRAFNKGHIDLLRQDEDVVERENRDARCLHFKLLDSPVNNLVHEANFFNIWLAEGLYDGFNSETHVDLRMCLSENVLEVNDAATE